MGQAVIKPSKGAVVGEVDVGQEALFMLESPEEHSTVILKMVPDTLPHLKGMREYKSRRIRRSHSVREVEMEEYQASEGETEDCSVSFTCHQRDKRRDMVEEQLVDVFYSAFHLHVPREAQPQEAAASSSNGDSNTAPLTTDELLKELADIYQVNEATLKLVEEEVNAKEPPRLTLHIIIHEAKDLKPKASKETSHPYCLVRISGSNETFKTRVLNSTLTPSWESQFSTEIPALRDAKLMVEVWHEPQEPGVEQRIAMRDLREIGRLVRNAAANIQMKEMRNLLGTVTVPLSELKDQSIEGWYNLVKSREDEINQVSLKEGSKPSKKRGSIHISLKVSTVAELNLIGPHWFDAFLKKVIHHHLGYLSSYSNFRRGSKRWSERSIHSTRSSTRRNKINTGSNINNKSNIININNKDYSTSIGTSSNGRSPESETVWNLPTPWNGSLSSTSQSLLDHYAATLNLTPPITILSWWKVSSECLITGQAFLLTLLKIVQGYLKDKRYSEEEIQEIRSSLKTWTSTQIDRLRNLTTYFPASTKYISCNQLEGMLRNLYAVENDPQTRELWVFPKDLSVFENVSEALTDFTKNWWESTLKNRGRNSPNATEDQQLVSAVTVAGEVFSFLSDVCSFYHNVFLREAQISYLKLTYILLTSELAARVRPLLIKIYDAPIKEKYVEADRRSLEAGTSVWQLYKKLECIEKIGENLTNDVQLQSGIQGYHKWFLGGVVRWQRRLFARTRDHISEEVEKDKFEVDPSCIRASSAVTSSNLQISSSASGSKSNFIIIKGLWQKLAWPYEVEGDKVSKQLLQDLCGLGIHYTKLVTAKFDSKLHEEDTLGGTVFLPAEICIGLNNIEYVRQEIESLPVLFEFLEEEDNRHQFSIVGKTVSKMEGSVLLFMDNIINKIKPVLRKAVVSSCNTGNEAQLLQEVLDEGLRVLQQRLDDTNFQRFLQKIWNILIVIFCDIVESNSTKQNAEYFKNVYNVLDRTWYFFTPTDRRGLEPQQAHTDEYRLLQNTLCNLKMATEFLIAKYYRERFDELKRSQQSCIAELYVQVFFTRTGKLIVEVIMVKNKIRFTGKHPDILVQIKLVPIDWFPNVVIAKTKPQKKSDPAVFNEIFEFPISHADQGVKSGHLLFVLKTHQRFHSGKVICETVIPLDEIDTTTPNNVKNKVLNMNIPRNEDDYTSVKALKFRTWDRKASSFLQKISTRV